MRCITLVQIKNLLYQHIYSFGTVRVNRIPQNKMPKETEKKKRGRGASEEMVASVENIDIACVLLMDNKLVSLMSIMTGSNLVIEIQRFDRKSKKFVSI